MDNVVEELSSDIEDIEDIEDKSVESLVEPMISEEELYPNDLPPKQVEVIVEIQAPLFEYDISELPRYKPLEFTSKKDVISHLQRKWG